MSSTESAQPAPPARPARPEYGEYATPEEQATQRGTPAVAASADAPTQPPAASNPLPGRPPGAGDRLASRLLLVLGALGLWSALNTAFSLNEFMSTAYAQYGIDAEFQPNDGTRIAQIAIAASHLLLYLAALIGTIRLIRRGRRAFWLPLSIGILAAIIFFVILMAVMLSDPNIYEFIARQAGVAG